MKIILKILALLLTIFFVILIAGMLWLKTDNAQILINKKISAYTKESLNLEVELKDISLNFPFNLNVSEIRVTDQEGSVGNIKNLTISTILSPSFFHQITINSLKADEINYFKNPIIKINETKKTKITQNNNYFFKPDIIVKKIDIAKINLGSEITGIEETISFNLNTDIKYKAQDEILDFKLLANQLLKHQLIKDASIKLDGLYNFKDNLLNLRLIEISSDLAVLTGNLLIDQQKNIIASEAIYQSDFINKYLEEKWSNFKADTNGKIIIQGTIKQPSINISGKFLVNDILDPDNQILPILYIAQLNIAENFNIISSINLKHDTLEVNGEINYAKNKLYLNNFVTTGNNLTSNLNLIIDIPTLLLAGSVTLKDNSLNEFSKYFPELQEGKIDIKADFSMPQNKQHVSINGKIEKIISTYGTLDFLVLDLNSPDIISKKLDASNILIHNLNIDSISFNEIKLHAKSVNENIILKTNIVSTDSRPFNFQIDSTLQLLNNDNIKLEVQHLAGKFDHITIKNTKNLSLYYGDKISLNIDKILIDKGDFNLICDLSPDKVSAHSNINNISAQIFDGLLPERLKHSVIDGKINLSGTGKEPILTSEIKINNIESKDENKKTSLNFKSTINHNQTNIDINANSANKRIAVVTGKISNKFTLYPLDFYINEDQDFMLNADLTDQFNILSLLPVFPGQQIEGILNGHISVTGTPALPIVKGKLKLFDGKYIYKNLGVEFKNVTSDITAEGYKINFSQIKAQDTFNNNMQGSGNLNIKTLDYYFEATTPKFNPINTPYIHGDVNGNITLKGNAAGAVATGNFALGPLEIRIPEHYVYNIPELNIVKIKGSNLINNHDNDPYELRLNIDLVTNDKVFVRGWGVDTRLEGDLKLTGNLNNPNIKGALHTVKGRYKEFGKILNIKEGVLTFDGPIMPSPYLNIVGETNVGGNLIRVILAGSIATPEIRLESTPDMPEERALSMLLFGTDTENISAFQAVQLADSARRLSGRGGNFDPLGMGRKILGVDDITVKTDPEDPGNTSIGVGKYLTDKIYLEIEQSQQSHTKTKVEIQLTPKISIENVIEQQGNTSIGINWRFDY